MIYVRWLNSVFRKGTERGHGNRRIRSVHSVLSLGNRVLHFITKHKFCVVSVKEVVNADIVLVNSSTSDSASLPSTISLALTNPLHFHS